MEFNLSEIKALQEVLCPKDSEVKQHRKIDLNANYQLGSDLRKELAPINSRIEAKVNLGHDEINSKQVRLKYDRPDPDYEILYKQKVGAEDVFLGLGDLDSSSIKIF